MAGKWMVTGKGKRLAGLGGKAESERQIHKGVLPVSGGFCKCT